MMEMTWESLDWGALDRLREQFLSEKESRASYWTSRSDLASYDFTYARRIAWKWDAALRELRDRGWSPPREPVLDWGCGSGAAGRRVVEFFGADRFTALQVFDRSRLAMEYAAEAGRAAFPGLPVEPAQAAVLEGEGPAGVLVLSHVLNELPESSRRRLVALIRRASAVLWVEPGTHAASRALIAMRERLLDEFDMIAPCTHRAPCGMLAPGCERHWCHHFAPPPRGLMADSNWVRFARRAGIDLRSLPYSFLAMERRRTAAEAAAMAAAGEREGWSRVIGEPRRYKGFAKVLSCQHDGIRELTVRERDAPGVADRLEEGAGGVFRWTLSGDRVVGAERIGPM